MWHSQSVRNLQSSSSNSFCSFLGAQRTQNVKSWEEGDTINEIMKTNSHYRKIRKFWFVFFSFIHFHFVVLWCEGKNERVALEMEDIFKCDVQSAQHSTACCDGRIWDVWNSTPLVEFIADATYIDRIELVNIQNRKHILYCRVFHHPLSIIMTNTKVIWTDFRIRSISSYCSNVGYTIFLI